MWASKRSFHFAKTNKRGLSERVLQWHHTSLICLMWETEINDITYIINRIGLSPKIYTGSSQREGMKVTDLRCKGTEIVFLYLITWSKLLLM